MFNLDDLKSVCFHFCEECNMQCKYCFAKFEYDKKEKKFLTEDESCQLVDNLFEFGFEKITFAGGEPTLCHWLTNIVKRAKENGFVTMLATNGTGLTDAFLESVANYLDWIALSVDSLDLDTLNKLGRQTRDNKVDKNYYYNRIDKINKSGIKLKISTVISAVNINEDLSSFINYARPLRWKLFQVFPNGLDINDWIKFEISKNDFLSFYERHRFNVSEEIPIAAEDIDVMSNSYVMIDPLGRFYQNQSNTHLYEYSLPILDIGVTEALSHIFIDKTKRKQRHAMYWK